LLLSKVHTFSFLHSFFQYESSFITCFNDWNLIIVRTIISFFFFVIRILTAGFTLACTKDCAGQMSCLTTTVCILARFIWSTSAFDQFKNIDRRPMEQMAVWQALASLKTQPCSNQTVFHPKMVELPRELISKSRPGHEPDTHSL